MPRIIHSIYLISTLLFLAACNNTTKQSNQADRPILVKTLLAGTTQNGIEKVYAAQIQETSAYNIGFATTGTIDQIHVKVNQKVNKGDIIATLDSRSAKNALAVAQATEKQAQDGYDRVKKVYNKGGVAEIKFVEVATSLQKAQALADIAQKNLEDCTLKAPFQGVVDQIHTKEGLSIIPQQPVITLIDVSEVYVTFTVSENEIAAIHIGDSCKIEIPAANLTTYSTIVEKSLMANTLSRSYTVKAKLSNPSNRLLEGMACKVYIQEKGTQGIIIPGKAIQTQVDGKSVWVIQNGRAVKQYIQTGAFVASGVLVTQGIDAGDSVVVEGYQKLYQNAKVRIK